MWAITSKPLCAGWAMIWGLAGAAGAGAAAGTGAGAWGARTAMPPCGMSSESRSTCSRGA